MMIRFTILLLVSAGAAGLVSAQVPVPATGCYHSAFTPNYPAGGAYGHANFDSLAQKKIAIEMFYAGWPSNKFPDFPSSQCNDIVAQGSVPHITWEPWVNGSPYPLDGIINGAYDLYIIGYALQTKSWGKPLFIRLGHEMNGNWYPWCGTNNGGNTTNGFGDPAKADGPERFIAAFRHVRHLFDSVGVTNVSWIWAVNNYSVPGDAWNLPEQFYPGDDVVDWIGYDGYNWGTSQSWSGWTNFLDVFTDVYNRFKSSSKPKMIAEFASAEAGGDKGQWIRDAYLYSHLYFTQLKAVTWFNINKETDWRINSSVRALTAYQQSVADAYYLDAVPSTAVRPEPPAVPGLRFLPASPNPSNGAVRFSFTIPSELQCTLTIRNVLGQDVAQVLSGWLTRGDHAVVWDARDRLGSTVPSGVYFAVLQAGSTHLTEKIVIVK